MPVISTNLAANSAVRYLNINSASQTSSLSKLASGSRIVQASDDAAGLAISTKISSDVTALNQAATNASHGISVLQTADGGASNISDILQRMKALASQASSGTVTDNERAYIDAEFQQLIDEVDAISVGTRYNGQSLLDGTSAFAQNATNTGGIDVMVGSDADDVIRVALDTLNAAGLGLTPAPAGDTVTEAGTDAGVDTPAVATADNPLAAIDVGAMAADLEFDINGVTVTLSQTGGAGGDGNYSAQDIVDAINADAGAEVTASLDAVTGALVLTSVAVGGTAEVLVDGWNGGDGGEDATILGFGVAAPPAENGADAGPAAAPADVVIDSTALTMPTDGSAVSFDINGATVTLDAAADADGDGAWSADEIEDVITAAFTAAGLTTLTATVNGTDIEIANSATGATASTVIDNFSTGLNAADLGLTADPVAPGGATGLSTASQATARAALDVLDTAISTVSKARANIGSLESRFGFHQASIATSVENLTAAISSIKDTDVAAEAAKLASAKVKTQAAVASAAQASQMPQELLKLLQ